MKLKVIELFSGIGSQINAIKRLNIPYELICTADINKESVVAYAAIHHNLTQELIDTYSEYPSRKDMVHYLNSINLGYDTYSNKSYDWDRYLNNNSDILNKYWLACKLSNNYGDISRINSLDYADLWTYSFPCQDISIIGKRKGIIKNKTKSGLLYEVQRLLNISKEHNTLPKYLLLENVKNLMSDRFIGSFHEWILYLNKLGYNNYYQILNAKDYGIPQSRERIFVVSIRKDIDDKHFRFPNPFDNKLRMKDFISDSVPDKYYYSKEITDTYVPITDKSNNKLKVKQLFSTIEPTQSETTNKLKVLGYIKKFVFESSQRVYDMNYICPTLNTVGGGNIEVKIIDNTNRIRKVTPKEYYKLTGFTEDEFNKASLFCTDSQLYYQAGNSIVVNVLYYIFKNLLSDYIPKE